MDNTAVLIGSPKTYEHLSRGKGSSPLGSILPDIVRFLAESNELTHIQALDSTHQRTLASSSKGIFENILYNTIGDFSDVEKCDFEISVKHKVIIALRNSLVLLEALLLCDMLSLGICASRY